MANWPRTVLPVHTTAADMPGVLRSAGHTGKQQIRSVMAVGRRWSETYVGQKRSDNTWAAFVAQVMNFWNNGTVFQVDHRAHRILRGAGGGTPGVNGASQTGASIVTSGWPNSVTVLRAGDVILLPGLTLVYDVTADVVSSGAGAATIPINPTIYVGGSPINGGAITINSTPGNVTFRATIDQKPTLPDAGPNEFYQGFSVSFVECP